MTDLQQDGDAMSTHITEPSTTHGVYFADPFSAFWISSLNF